MYKNISEKINKSYFVLINNLKDIVKLKQIKKRKYK